MRELGLFFVLWVPVKTGGGLRARSPVPFYQLFGGGGTKMDYRKKGALILTSLLEDLEGNQGNKKPSGIWGWSPKRQTQPLQGVPSL